ncbi:Tn3 family transposase [Streptomyces sp. Ncost-T10-10d]|uniref:Tn3 family transposase n=1 Tax=Streptomyces sp. Ncost-T10-10d TaxID=1839774 RepID=UPI000D1A2595
MRCCPASTCRGRGWTCSRGPAPTRRSPRSPGRGEVEGPARDDRCAAGRARGRRSLVRRSFTATPGQLCQRYQDGAGDRIGCLGLVLNALVLFNTRYVDAAVNQPGADGLDVRDEDVARLSPLVRRHINMLGRYSFVTRGSSCSRQPNACCCGTARTG